MGTWGPGIYANDVVADLKSTLTSVMRLPLDGDAIIELLLEFEPSLGDPGSEEPGVGLLWRISFTGTASNTNPRSSE